MTSSDFAGFYVFKDHEYYKKISAVAQKSGELTISIHENDPKNGKINFFCFANLNKNDCKELINTLQNFVDGKYVSPLDGAAG